LDRVTRKALKTDRFAVEVTHSVEYVTEHRRQALLYGGAALVLLLLAGGGYFWVQKRRSSAHEALYKALETAHAAVTEEESFGRLTFRTEKEKNDKALKDFQDVLQRFPKTSEARIARYYVGLVHNETGNVAEAQKQLEQAIRDGHDDVLALARLSLADLYLEQGKDEEARKLYQFLIENPTATVSEGRAQLAMARFLRPRKPEEARKLLLELMKRPGPVAGAAGTMIRELGQQ